MQAMAGAVTLSPTDLSAFLGCRHRTGLDLAAALGLLERPRWTDPFAEILQQRGEAHERQFVDSLRGQGLAVADVRDADDRAAATLQAMQSGVHVIVQARLDHGTWTGYADILRRVEMPSNLGRWSYEVWDTKLARDTRGGTILQLSAYSDLLSRLQGRQPERFYVVTPDPVTPVHEYRVDDYAAYYRLVRAQIEAAVLQGADALQALHYPEPVDQCEVCRWWTRCNDRRRQDDHLSFIAGASRLHRRELEANNVGTLAAVAAMPVPIPFEPIRGSRAVYERVREQAQLQERRRSSGELAYTPLPIEADEGLCRLPAPSAGDLFLDLEGDPFAREGGREYLFGLGQMRSGAFEYRCWWAHTDTEEREAFEQAADAIAAAVEADPNAHVYHFGHYEPAAFKRLMGRYATRESAIDRLLRGERFVDLFAVVRHALRAGVESYSIKELEAFYRFVRDVPLDAAGRHRQIVELALESTAADTIPDAARRTVVGYNRDDCRSTQALREWLEQIREQFERSGTPVARPGPGEDDAPEQVTALEEQVAALRSRLLACVPADPAARNPEDSARWLLAWLLDWHRREFKAQLWEYYRLRDLPEEELLDEPKAIAGLQYVAEVAKVKKSTVQRYTYPPQDVDMRPGVRLKLQDKTSVGTLEALDRRNRTIDVKQGPSRVDVRPSAVFAHETFTPDVMQQSILRIAAAVADEGFIRRCPATDLLLRRPPRLRRGAFSPDYESASDFAVRIAGDLDGTVLPIQGPPGAGKTFAGARMICALVAAGKRVGITAVGHKVIDNLLEAVVREAARTSTEIKAVHRTDPDADVPDGVEILDDNDAVYRRLADHEANVAGGTAWLWARPEAANTVDVLFVDEAGQMSLANVLAVCQAAESVVLLGDPQQLEQPQKASHPDGTDISALEHVLGGAQTMPADRGIFLPETWRLPPAICDFTSELFYEARLQTRAGTGRQRLSGTAGFDGAGLWWVPVAHQGSQSWSPEEIEAVTRVVGRLLQPDAGWVHHEEGAKALTGSDILVVTPYNAHVNRLQEALRGSGVQAGTVDTFQGQDKAVVIYSMAASSAEDAPRGMGFLYRLNRLNVATSRARCAAILVASPRLLEPECRTPQQMHLANAICRFRELATERRL
jgi:uncharacterized protein